VIIRDRTHSRNTRLQLAEEGQNLIPSQLLAQNCTPPDISAMRLEHILRQVEPDRDNLQHDRPRLWIRKDPLWHIYAVGGRLHHHSWHSLTEVAQLPLRLRGLGGEARPTSLT
jgi:hypothetical protein